MVTGRPSIAARISAKSSRCSGSIAASAASLSGLVVGQDEVLDQHSAVAEEHVLGAAQADPAAPNRRARVASSGVSAFARTPIRRTRVGVVEQRRDGIHDGVVDRSSPSK